MHIRMVCALKVRRVYHIDDYVWCLVNQLLTHVDLPGTYSLSAYSPEELYVRKQLGMESS